MEKIPFWLKLLLKITLQALIKRLLQELREGIWIKVPFMGDILHIHIKLEDDPPVRADWWVLD